MRKQLVPHLAVVGFITEAQSPQAAGQQVREVLDDLLSRDPDHLDALDAETLLALHKVLQGTLAKRRAQGLAVVKSWLAEHKNRRAGLRSADAADLLARLALKTGDARFATGSLEPGTLQQLRGETGANAPEAVGVFAWLCFAYGALVGTRGENTTANRADFAKELRKKK